MSKSGSCNLKGDRQCFAYTLLLLLLCVKYYIVRVPEGLVTKLPTVVELSLHALYF